MPRTVVAFDLYGTLLSTTSIASALTALYGEDSARKIAASARQHQLEYTWRINSMGIYRSFEDLTRASFRQAAAEAHVEFSPEDEDHIMEAYNDLDTFPDADVALENLPELGKSLDPWIFSNGTKSMITSSLKAALGFHLTREILSENKVISVDDVHVFKPDRRTYEHLVEASGMMMERDNVWLVSSNAWDAMGAVAAGLKSVWVDKTALGWVDGLGGALGIRPTVITENVAEAVKEIARRAMDNS